MTLAFDHSYARDLPGTYLRVSPDVAPAPRLLVLNGKLADGLGLDLTPDQARDWFSGAALPPGADPIAQAYLLTLSRRQGITNESEHLFVREMRRLAGSLGLLFPQEFQKCPKANGLSLLI